MLSLPTKEYFQSSGWVEEQPPPMPGATPKARGRDNKKRGATHSANTTEVRSVRSGSDFWAGGRSRTPSSSTYTAGQSQDLSDVSLEGHTMNRFPRSRSQSQRQDTSRYTTEEGDDNDSQGTETPGTDADLDDGLVDEVGAQDAFIAGMIYALSRRILPGVPYTPSWSGEDITAGSAETDRGRWRLDECLR